MSSLGPTDPVFASPENPGASPAAEFRRQWQLGEEPQIEAFLAAQSPLSPRELAAVVRVDLRQRWLRSQRAEAEEYFSRFPLLRTEAELAVDVIYAEFLAREEHGEQPQVSEYERRFPAFGEVLADQIGLHRALDECDQPPIDETFVVGPETEQTLGPGGSRPDRLNRLEADYEVMDEIGRGGMGVVFRARQLGLNRLVALKMVRAVDGSNQELLARFRAEAEVVASLHHPQIVQIYDYGEHKGLPYLALEFVEGGTLAARLDGTPWSGRQAAALVAELARAVQFAHDRRVIHRDLKPGNLLIASEENGLQLKIADFGLAKVFRDIPSTPTQTGTLLGTPSYMAPEQAGGHSRDIGPATDVYALGAILYELLTGRPPFRGETPMETLQQLLATEPVSIHRLAPRVPRDLGTICAKCLLREPQRRYASAAGLADDLARFLADQPIHARRTGGLERGWRWCRRNPPLAIALGSVAALLVAVAVVSTWYSGRLSSELTKTQRAEQAEREASESAQIRLWDAYLAEIAARNASHQVGQRFAALEAADRAGALLKTIGRTDQRVLQLRSATLNSLALPDLRRMRTIGVLPKQSHQCSLSLDAGRYVATTMAGEIVGFQLTDGHEVFRIKHRGQLAAPAISPDGLFIAVSGDDGTQVWRVDEPQPVIAWENAGSQQFTFAPGGQHAATSDARAGMHLVDVTTGATVRKLGHGEADSPFSFHAASRRIAVCAADSVQVISWDTGETLIESSFPTQSVARVAWHPSGQYIAAWGNSNGNIVLWDVQTRKKAIVYQHRAFPLHLEFSDDGSRLLSYSLWDQRLILWDVGTGQKLLEIKGFANFACDVSPEGKIILLRSSGTAAELWELDAGAECQALAHNLHPPLGTCVRVSVSPDSRILVVGREHGLEMWDLDTCQRLVNWPCGVCMAEFDRAGDLILACTAGIFRWPRQYGDAVGTEFSPDALATCVVRFGPPRRLNGPVDSSSLSTGPVDNVFAFKERGRWNVMHEVDSQTKVRLEAKHDARRAAISDDGRHVALANWEDGGASVFEAANGRHLVDLAIGQHGIVMFSPDSRWLATTPDGVRLWRVADWQLARELHASGTTPTGLGIAYSPDSRVLAVGQTDGVLRLVDPETGVDWAHLSNADLGCASHIVFSPDQTRLITLPLEDQPPGRIWDLAAMRRELAKRGLDWPNDVLQSESRPSSSPRKLEIVLDDSGLMLLINPLERQRSSAKTAIEP